MKEKLNTQAVPMDAVRIEDHFWKPRIDANRQINIPYQYQQLHESGVLDNFLRINGNMTGPYAGPYWMDSDAYKWIEAASYCLALGPDAQLEAKVDAVITVIVNAQEEDGYLNTYFQWVEPEKKWTNLGMGHELYCAGHLIQAALAHYRATGKQTLLTVACRFADHIATVFGPGKLAGLPGHAEIEMALVDLFRCTQQERYLQLAQYFIDQRGQSPSRFCWELANLDLIGGGPEQLNPRFYGTAQAYDGRYAQDHLPVREQSEVVGHAVRAMYLFCGMADLAAETKEVALVDAMERLWANLTQRRMYITGGIGSSERNEGFTEDYDLPNATAYAETCAAVGLIMWNHRLLQLKGDSRFADLIELVLYNAFLAGISLDSKKYFYTNPLFSDGTHHRQDWFYCACCPPNIARLLASLGQYLYTQTDDGVGVELYIQSVTQVKVAADAVVTIRQKSDYPWDGRIQLRLALEQPTVFTLRLRIPGWCQHYEVMVNSQPVTVGVERGYAKLQRQWANDDVVELVLAMSVEMMEAHPAVRANTGRVALQRGPLVYCLEDVDHLLPVTHITLPKEPEFKVKFEPKLLGGVNIIESEGLVQPSLARTPIKAIPYYAWDNRKPGAMAVWLLKE